MESVHMLFAVFVIFGHTAPAAEAGILDPIRNMFSPFRNRSQSRPDLDKLFYRLRDHSETLDAIDLTDFDPKITANPDYSQIQFGSYQDRPYKTGHTLILNRNADVLIKTTHDKPKPPVQCKIKAKEQKPPPKCPSPLPECPKPPPECPKPPPKCPLPLPECPKPIPECPKPCKCPKPLPECPQPLPKCPKPPPECPKPLPKCPKPSPDCLQKPIDSKLKAKFRDQAKLCNNATAIDTNDSKLHSELLSNNSRLPSDDSYNSKLPSDGPLNSEMPSDPLNNSELPVSGNNSKFPSDPLSNSRLPIDSPYHLKLPSGGPFDSELPFDDLDDSNLPSNGPFNSKFPSNVPHKSGLPSDGSYDLNLPSDNLSKSKILTNDRSNSGLRPVGPNISKLPNDDVSNSRWDTDEPDSPNLDDFDSTFDSNYMWPEDNQELLETSSTKISQDNDYDKIIAQKFPAAAKLLEKLRKLNKLKELHKINEYNENDEDSNINTNVNNNHNTGNGGNNEYFKAKPHTSTVKSRKNYNNEDIDALLQPEGVYMRVTTSSSVNGGRVVMRKLTKKRFYYQARSVKPENE